MSTILCFTVVIVLHNCVYGQNTGNNPCPELTVAYNNESCYVFVGEDVTRNLYNEIWKLKKKIAEKTFCLPSKKGVERGVCEDDGILQPGRTRGIHRHDIDGCVWDKPQALRVCREMHKVNLPSYPLYKLAAYSKIWHLPIIETYEEDEWLNEQLNKGKNKIMGTHFWIDLIKLGDRYVWESTGELADWIHLPDGVDRWWEKNNVLRKPRPGDLKMCYEYHTNYGDVTKPEQLPTDRKPHKTREVRGWHKRRCTEAYEQVSNLDAPEDFTKEEETQTRGRWLHMSTLTAWCGDYGVDAGGCMIPEDLENNRREVGLAGEVRQAECHNKPIMFVKDKFRMLLAPTGVVCEVSIECINDPTNPKCQLTD